MEKIIETEKIPIKLWLDDSDETSIRQIRNIANLPFAYSHACLMPDAHSGYGMPIGGVFATENVIVPNAVGVDIGCGMCAIQTSLNCSELSAGFINSILSEIRKYIPLGFEHHQTRKQENFMPTGHNVAELKVVNQNYFAALKQIGTLGGGNHFIEIQKDESDRVWIMIHSGSRNLGFKVADFYNNKAKKLNKLWFSSVNQTNDLAFLPFETGDARDYYLEMKYCVDFAFANRRLMMTRIQKVFLNYFPDLTFEPIINIAHNYAAWEMHFGKKVIVHRKGATSAKLGEIGIIPGCQGTISYIVEGLGNPDSFASCSHGAGRKMSRNQAVKNLNLEEEIQKLHKQGIIHSIRNQKDLDEAPSAYKDILKVIDSQKDLVKIKHTLYPMAVIKG